MLVRAGTLYIDHMLWQPVAIPFGLYTAKVNIFASV